MAIAERSVAAHWPTESEVVSFAESLISVPSFTGHETALAEHVCGMLRDYGINAQLQEVEPGRSQVIARVGPSEGLPALLYNGHLDMDPIGREWQGDPFKADRVDDKLYGAGIHNMKSGLAAIIGAAVAIERGSVPLRKALLLQFVVGELQGGKGTIFALKSGLRAEAAVVPEPYSVSRIITRTAGVHKFSIVVRGKAAHTSRSEEGVDAIRVLLDIIRRFESAELGLVNPDFPTLPKCQVGSIIGGRGENHVLSGVSYNADKATAIIDVRYPPPYEPSDVGKATTQAVAMLASEYPHAEVIVEHPPDPCFGVGGADMPPMDVPPDTALVRDLTRALEQASDFKVTETGIALPFSYCGNDTTHLSRAGIECCLFGPRGQGNDTERHVLISEMLACARALTVLAEARCV
jgi:acetylornithine deacetylase